MEMGWETCEGADPVSQESEIDHSAIPMETVLDSPDIRLLQALPE